VTVAILDWDTDLENNLLSQSGITINSINATYEFDFQPKTPNFDFPSYLLQKNMELPNAIFRCFFFIKRM
jgi:citrate synthase